MADHMEAIKNGHPSPYTKEEVEEARTNYRELKAQVNDDQLH